MNLRSVDHTLARGTLPAVHRLIRDVVTLPFGRTANAVVRLDAARATQNDPEDYSKDLRHALAALIAALKATWPVPHDFGSPERDAAVALFRERLAARLPGAVVTRDTRVEIILDDQPSYSTPIALVVELPAGMAIPPGRNAFGLVVMTADVSVKTGLPILVSKALSGGEPEPLPFNTW